MIDAYLVYFARSGPFLKIGHSYDPENRLPQLKGTFRGTLPEKPSLIGSVPGSQRLEHLMHKYFSAFRMSESHRQREWFDAVPEALERVRCVLDYSAGNPSLLAWKGMLQDPAPRGDVSRWIGMGESPLGPKATWEAIDSGHVIGAAITHNRVFVDRYSLDAYIERLVLKQMAEDRAQFQLSPVT